MATTESPITRSELREELRHYATKEDLANLRADLMGAITSATRWNIGVMLLVGGAAVAILRLT
ncbi:MAG: hypothetical protein J4F43_08570 [Dehalococcoidia bacterium]|nr:hypothetical protein [Dehalococcoidia bacterium]